MNMYELTPRFDARKSFYGKAHVFKDQDGAKVLQSYNTNVAKIYTSKEHAGIMIAEVYGGYSQTTLRHIKEFLLQHGFKAVNKKQILNDYGVSQYI